MPVADTAEAPRLRLLYLSWRDRENPEAGGAETFTERTAEVLTELGHEVTIVTSRFPGSVAVDRHGPVRVLRRGGRFTCYLRGMLYAAQHRDDFDLILDVQNGVPFWSPLVTRTPVINIVHHTHRDQWSVIFPQRVARIGWFLESRVAPWVYRRSRYVTVSQASRRDLVGLGVDADRIDLVYSGNDHPADLQQYADVPRTSAPSITVLGRLVPHKQVEIAIDILADLADEQPELRLNVVGEGYWRDALVAHAQERGVVDRVDFHGFVSEERKHHLLAQSWLVLMPSHKEGWGLTIVEAGLHAALAFAHAGGPTESIMHGLTGLLATDADDLTDQVRVLLSNHDLRHRLGVTAREHALSFDWRSSGAQLERSIRSVLGQVERPDSPPIVAPRLRSLEEIVAEHESATPTP